MGEHFPFPDGALAPGGMTRDPITTHRSFELAGETMKRFVLLSLAALVFSGALALPYGLIQEESDHSLAGFPSGVSSDTSTDGARLEVGQDTESCLDRLFDPLFGAPALARPSLCDFWDFWCQDHAYNQCAQVGPPTCSCLTSKYLGCMWDSPGCPDGHWPNC